MRLLLTVIGVLLTAKEEKLARVTETPDEEIRRQVLFLSPVNVDPADDK